MHPLSLFPQLLWLAPLAYALLRVAVGLVFLWIGYYYYRGREELSHVRAPVVGSGMWVPLFASAAFFVFGVALIAGYYTQLMALLGAIGALKLITFKRAYPAFMPLPRSTSFLLLVICIALVFTGAGAFALDLPL